jgi:CCCH zinc finger in TRM13 protein
MCTCAMWWYQATRVQCQRLLPQSSDCHCIVKVRDQHSKIIPDVDERSSAGPRIVGSFFWQALVRCRTQRLCKFSMVNRSYDASDRKNGKPNAKPRCQYHLAKKGRDCRFEAVDGKPYCGNHLYHVCGEGPRRVPCTIDSTQ